MQRGYTILIIVLVLASIGVLLITSVGFLGVDSIKNSVSYRDSKIGFYLSTLCAENALDRIKVNPSYITKVTKGVPTWVRLTVNKSLGYYCRFQVINKKAPKIINTKSDIENFPRYLEVIVEDIIVPEEGESEIIISSWQEK